MRMRVLLLSWVHCGPGFEILRVSEMGDAATFLIPSRSEEGYNRFLPETTLNGKTYGLSPIFVDFRGRIRKGTVLDRRRSARTACFRPPRWSLCGICTFCSAACVGGKSVAVVFGSEDGSPRRHIPVNFRRVSKRLVLFLFFKVNCWLCQALITG